MPEFKLTFKKRRLSKEFLVAKGIRAKIKGIGGDIGVITIYFSEEPSASDKALLAQILGNKWEEITQ